MRMGARTMALKEGSCIAKLYGTLEVTERHRLDRYMYEKDADLLSGLTVTGVGEEGRVEALEADGKAFMMAVSAHPEFKSRPDDAHPLFRAFIAEALK